MLEPQFITQRTDEKESHGTFILEPLPLSFGQSLGLALRRTLLSSLKGAAITSVKVQGAPHLFSTIKGVKESVLEIVLNLKKLRLAVGEGDGPFRLSLAAKGAGKVKGKDMKGDLKVVNDDLYIAELTNDKAKLEIEVIVEIGVGFSPAEEREKKEFGFTPIDAYFSPIKKVNFKVEEARVGRKSNQERLILEIWSDGSVSVNEALKKSSQLLGSYFEHILSGKDEPKQKQEMIEAEKQKGAIDQKLYEIIIDELNLPSRVINALLRENIETVADLVKVGKERLTSMKGVGKKSIELIEEELNKMGIELK